MALGGPFMSVGISRTGRQDNGLIVNRSAGAVLCRFATYLATVLFPFDSAFFADVFRLVGQVKIRLTARKKSVSRDRATYLTCHV